MKVGVLGNTTIKKENEGTVEELIEFLSGNGYEPVRFSTHTEIDNVDVVLVLGGDGAILHAAVVAAQKNIKIIGINYGTLGFLTEYEKAERTRVKELLEALERNSCRIVKRSLLQVDIDGKQYYGLNEISVQRDYGKLGDNLPQILRLEIEAKEGVDEIAGDGLLICTPTGSTAYSLSAGGAIITPEVPVFMLTPICAFSMRARPIVFADTDEFAIRVKKGKGMLLVDGGAVTALPDGAELQVKKAPFTADFPVKESAGFLARVRNKLNG
ncbi:MAG: NAD(+)/NADH kinase [Clostridia bacterium]|nr:NAD(+)/NADH kinase [Clostridia bacterium]